MELKQRHITKEEDKLPAAQKIGYGMGAMATNVAVNSTANLTNLIYNIGLGVSPILLGLGQCLPRIWDAVTDPLIGNLSDNTRSRFGRRIPYIFAGGIGLGITFAFLWMPPRGLGETATFAYFLAMSILFYTAATVFDVPRGALGYELTPDYHEKTRLFATSSFLINVGSLMIPWLYFIANLDWFADEVEGMKYVGIVLGIILILSAVTCAVVCKERKFQQVKAQPRIPLRETITTTAANRTFLRLLGIVLLVTIGFYFVAGYSNYILIFYVYQGDKQAASVMMGWCGTLWSLLSLAGVFLMTSMATRIGKTMTVMIFLIVMACGNLLKIVCYSRAYPWLVLIPTALLSLGMLVLFSLVFAMIADICDEDELRTGRRREGSYHAMYGWWWKVGIGLSYIVQGFLLRATGFNEKLPAQAESTLFWLRFWEITLPAAMCLISAGLLTKYPLTEARAYEIKARLEERRKTAAETEESGQTP